MKYRIQSFVFPINEKHLGCRKLFYRGDMGILEPEQNRLTIGFAQHCDFVTYLNACSWQKWQKYTCAKKLSLHLKLQGKARVNLIGYHKEALNVTQTEFSQEEAEAGEATDFRFDFPDNDEQMVGCEITALSDKLVILGGYYEVEVPEKGINEVRLAIATTTFQKEEFIRDNMRTIQREVLNQDDDIAEGVYLHIVDNGRTLSEDDIHGKHTLLHPNINAGGSGGFARGMIEGLNQTPKATHVLLMDDDVLVLSESIKRTFCLLRLLKPEFQGSFISGAMLYYEKPMKQHEDVGSIRGPLKRRMNQTKLHNNLENERQYPALRDSYAAWWYCCIPVKTIEENGLPLPLFIRMDDAEYGMRCKPDFITMNGICVWHLGFTTKKNPLFDKYQTFRNELIGKATTGVLADFDIIGQIYGAYRIAMMQFDYNTAELVICALEDYCKGPDFVMKQPGNEIIAQHKHLVNKLRPLDELEGGDQVKLESLDEDLPLRFENRIRLKLTWNGQKALSRKGSPEIIPIEYCGKLQPERIAGHSRILAVNPYDRTGVLLVKDRARFKQLQKRYRAAQKYYKKHREGLEEAYRDQRERMTSEEFWREYLGI